MSSREMNRRTVLAGTAALMPAAALAAAPVLAEPDPIYAAIEAHRRAWAGLDEACDVLCAAEEAGFKARDKSDKQRVIEANRIEWEATLAEGRAQDIVNEAEDQFILNQPTTILGVAALLRYTGEHDVKTGDTLFESSSQFKNDEGDIFDFHEAFRMTLADSLERIVAGKPIEPGRLTKCEITEDDEGPAIALATGASS